MVYSETSVWGFEVAIPAMRVTLSAEGRDVERGAGSVHGQKTSCGKAILLHGWEEPQRKYQTFAGVEQQRKHADAVSSFTFTYGNQGTLLTQMTA